jgi:hypothetical protein
VAGGYTRKMLPRHIEAYDRAHQETCATSRTRTNGGRRGAIVLTSRARDSALRLLAATFNTQSTISRNSHRREREQRASLFDRGLTDPAGF